MQAGRVGAAVAAVMLLGAGAVRAETVVNPDWAVKPDGADLAAAFPPLAKALMIPGYATIACSVTAAGAVTDCSVVSETPKGLGFGPAAVSMAPKMKFTPKQVDGQAVDGGVVRMPIRFSLPEPELLPAKVTPSSPGALDVARKMLAPEMTATLTERYAASTAKLEAEPTPGVDPASQRRGVEAIRTTARAVIPAWVDAVAQTYASMMPEDLLAADLTYRQSAGGHAYKDHAAEIRAAYGAAGERAQRVAGAEMMRLWCAKQTSLPCPPPAALPAEPAAPAKAASAQALATARDIVKADGIPDEFARTAAMFTPEVLNLPQVDAAARAAIAQGGKAAFEAQGAKAVESLAVLHASLFTEAELGDILAYKSSPTAGALRTKEADLYKAQVAINEGYANQVSARARALYCKSAACTMTAAAPAAKPAPTPKPPKPAPTPKPAAAPRPAPAPAPVAETPAPAPASTPAPAPKADKSFIPTPRKKPFSSR